MLIPKIHDNGKIIAIELKLNKCKVKNTGAPLSILSSEIAKLIANI